MSVVFLQLVPEREEDLTGIRKELRGRIIGGITRGTAVERPGQPDGAHTPGSAKAGGRQ
jgi:hypothetical protein